MLCVYTVQCLPCRLRALAVGRVVAVIAHIERGSLSAFCLRCNFYGFQIHCSAVPRVRIIFDRLEAVRRLSRIDSRKKILSVHGYAECIRLHINIHADVLPLVFLKRPRLKRIFPVYMRLILCPVPVRVQGIHGSAAFILNIGDTELIGISLPAHLDLRVDRDVAVFALVNVKTAVRKACLSSVG